MKIIKIISLMLIIFFLSLDSVSSNEITSPVIDLKAGYIIVEGVGLIPTDHYSEDEQMRLARLAAKLDAQRNILEIIANLRLNSEVSMVNDIDEEGIKTRIDGILKDAKIIPESELFSDGVYRLQMRVQVKKLTPVVYPAPKEAEINPVSEIFYTGLIIDASELDMKLCDSWEIRDSEGTLIYSSARALYKPGSSVFINSIDEAFQNTHLGDNPLIFTAIRNIDKALVVSVQDGRMILSSLQDTDVFLLSKIAVIIGGSK